jgi:hypothetical protein
MELDDDAEQRHDDATADHIARAVHAVEPIVDAMEFVVNFVEAPTTRRASVAPSAKGSSLSIYRLGP